MEVHEMKRDLELARRLLAEIEARGTDCSVSVLRSGPEHDTEERVRYHLRLLIDAGLLKEVDRTSSGIPCIRLTNDGHELLELSRSETRWRDAIRLCQRRTGGTSLAAVRSILARWAVAGVGLPPRRYVAPRYRYVDRYMEDEPIAEQPIREPVPVEIDRWGRAGIDLDGDGVADIEYDPVLPRYIY
jgi:hypothetical protein